MNSMSFPELNDLLAKYGLKNEEFAEVLGIDAVSFEKKLTVEKIFLLLSYGI